MRNLSLKLTGLAFGLALSFAAGAQVQEPPYHAPSTTTNGAVTTANAFQSALAADPFRKGCLIVNNSAAAELVYLGPPGSATSAQAIPVPAGQSFNCGTYQGVVITDQISITSATQGATFVVVKQTQ